MFAGTTPDIDVTQSLTGARDSTVIGLAETVNVAYNLLPEDLRARPTTQQVFQQINQLIYQLNQQLKETENKRLSRLVNMNIERYVQGGIWALYGLGIVAAIDPFMTALVLLVVMAALVGAVLMSASYVSDYQRAAAATRQAQQKIDAFLQQVDPRLSLALTRPYRSASRFPVLNGYRRWQLIQVILLTLGGFALITLMLPGPDFEEVWLIFFMRRVVLFLAAYTLVVVLAGNLRLGAERIKLQLFTEDHLFHLRFGTTTESYVQIVDTSSLIDEAVTADALQRPVVLQTVPATPGQPPAESQSAELVAHNIEAPTQAPR